MTSRLSHRKKSIHWMTYRSKESIMPQFLFELSVVIMAWILPGLILGIGGGYMRKEGARRWD